MRRHTADRTVFAFGSKATPGWPIRHSTSPRSRCASASRWQALTAGMLLVADARIDNREELHSRFGGRGDCRPEPTDADLILAAFRRWRRGLSGAAARATSCSRCGTRSERKLFLARDALGRAQPVLPRRGPALPVRLRGGPDSRRARLSVAHQRGQGRRLPGVADPRVRRDALRNRSISVRRPMPSPCRRRACASVGTGTSIPPRGSATGTTGSTPSTSWISSPRRRGAGCAPSDRSACP